jgi:hypothetical protein
MNEATLIYLAVGMSAAALLLGIFSAITSGQARFWRKHFRGEAEPENLQEIMEAVAGKIKKLEDAQAVTNGIHDSHAATLMTALQNVGLIRFDSSGDDGGNLSFAIALLDADQSGVIITSLHGRQYNRIYAKAVLAGKSEQTLSSEEQEALIQALTNKKVISN